MRRSARTVLCGGYRAIGIPTATAKYLPLRVHPHFRLTASGHVASEMANMGGIGSLEENGGGGKKALFEGGEIVANVPAVQKHVTPTGLRESCLGPSRGAAPSTEYEARFASAGPYRCEKTAYHWPAHRSRSRQRSPRRNGRPNVAYRPPRVRPPGEGRGGRPLRPSTRPRAKRLPKGGKPARRALAHQDGAGGGDAAAQGRGDPGRDHGQDGLAAAHRPRSEEHTSELQSLRH